MKKLKRISTDRATGRKIGLFLLTPQESGRVWGDQEYWMFTDINRTDSLAEFNLGHSKALPQDYCWRSLESGDICKVAVRPENVRAQLWACGRHMARFQAEEARKASRKKREILNEQRSELEDYELEKYLIVYERLCELGWGYLLEKPQKPRWGRMAGIEITLDIGDFLEMVDPDQEEEVDNAEDFTTVEEDLFTSDL